MKDQQDIVLTPNTGLGQGRTTDEIAQKVLEDIPLDDDNLDTI